MTTGEDMRKEFTEAELLKHRIHTALMVHDLSEADVAQHLGISKGHLKHILYYGRTDGAARVFEGLSELLGFDPRYGISPEMRGYLNMLASPPRKEAGPAPRGS